jgi:hypothetical protein
MSKYTPDDNRSMQLNPNNERYWNVREDECDDDFEVDDSERLTCLPRPSPRASTGDGDIGDYIRQSHRSSLPDVFTQEQNWRKMKRLQQENEDRRGEQETIDYIKGR